MIARFRVATRACGPRRTVHVHIYQDRERMARQHCKDRGRPYDDSVHGGVAIRGGWHWPHPDPQPPIVMRLWTGQLTTRTIAHEALHAAAFIALMDALPGWDSRARTLLIGDNEPLAYAVGDITSEVVRNLYRLHLLPSAPEETK
jgi:hypothetical protein